MPDRFDQNTVQQYGGVKWAKEQINQLYPGAIDGQIQGYNQVKSSLNQIIDTLNTANASLQASWSGDASTAASQTFTDTSNHASNVVSTVDNTITQLQNAKSAATTAQVAMNSVPNEVPVPHPGLFGSIVNSVSDAFGGTDPVQQAQQHNTAARTQAAEVLNTLSQSYESSAKNMTSIAKGHDSGFTASNPTPAGAFNLGAGSYGGGSGAAAGYTRDFATSSAPGSAPPGVGPVKVGGFSPGNGHTNVQGVVPPEHVVTTPIPQQPIGGGAPPPPSELFPFPPGGGPIVPPNETAPPGSIPEENLLGDGLGGETAPGGLSKLGASNVFGEEGFGNESGGGVSQRGLSANALGADGEPDSGGIIGGGSGAALGEGQAGMRPGMGGARGAGGASGEEDLGPLKYSRGRFFGDEPEGNEEWIRPSVGGDESLLVNEGSQVSGPGRVRSAYEGATDAEGNPLHMMRGGGGVRSGLHDEDDERGERPGYLKEDPEWWKSAQKVSPPVVE